MPPIIYLTFIVGLALIVVGVLGGGLEIKEVKNSRSTNHSESFELRGWLRLNSSMPSRSRAI